MRISDWSSDLCSSDLVFYPDITQVEQPPFVVAGGVPHHQVGWGVESIDQQPGFLIDVQAERPAHAAHPVFAQPGLGGGEQGVENGRVGGRFEKTEAPGLVVMLIQMQFTNLRTNRKSVV